MPLTALFDLPSQWLSTLRFLAAHYPSVCSGSSSCQTTRPSNHHFGFSPRHPHSGDQNKEKTAIKSINRKQDFHIEMISINKINWIDCDSRLWLFPTMWHKPSAFFIDAHKTAEKRADKVMCGVGWRGKGEEGKEIKTIPPCIIALGQTTIKKSLRCNSMVINNANIYDRQWQTRTQTIFFDISINS